MAAVEMVMAAIPMVTAAVGSAVSSRNEEGKDSAGSGSDRNDCDRNSSCFGTNQEPRECGGGLCRHTYATIRQRDLELGCFGEVCVENRARKFAKFSKIATSAFL